MSTRVFGTGFANIRGMSMGITSQSVLGASQDVLQAIKSASNKTGVDFDYLVNQARTESSFDTNAKAKTSSATGLYQFIDQTWLSTVSKHGSEHGLGELSSQIKQDFQGRYYVADDTVKQEILSLRKDPEIASIMAAEFASDNGDYLLSQTGQEANSTDLYMAHFLGAGGASKFINAMNSTPTADASDLFPSAAKANKNIFYNSDGSSKSLIEIYNKFSDKFNDVMQVQVAGNDNAVDVQKSYSPDVTFSRIYGDNVTNYVRAMPSVSGFNSGSFFEGLYGDGIGSLVQNQIGQSSLFLTLTMLDLPK